MNIKPIKEYVRDDKKVTFEYFRDNKLWYSTECGFVFPVPISDKAEIGNATFNAQEKAIHLMRYIRKYIAEIEKEG